MSITFVQTEQCNVGDENMRNKMKEKVTRAYESYDIYLFWLIVHYVSCLQPFPLPLKSVWILEVVFCTCRTNFATLRCSIICWIWITRGLVKLIILETCNIVTEKLHIYKMRKGTGRISFICLGFKPAVCSVVDKCCMMVSGVFLGDKCVIIENR